MDRPTAEPTTESSLDRFLRQRGAGGLGLYGKRVVLMQGIMAGVMGLLGLAALIPGTGLDPGVAFGFLFGSGMCLGVSQIVRFRLQPLMATSNWKLSPEAKGLVLKLVQERSSWGGGFGFGPGRGRHARRIARLSGDSSFGWFGRSASKVDVQVIDLLELACTQFNRVQGILDSPSAGSLSKISATAAKATDDAMASVLDCCATLDRYPESAGATRQQIEREIASMTELADRLEDLATRSDIPSTTTTMDSVLEDLRLEQLARSELQATSSVDETVQNRA